MSGAQALHALKLFLMALLCLGLLVILVRTVNAHGSAEWIERGAIKNRVGELCCGQKDCGELVRGTVIATPAGYRVDGVFRVQPTPDRSFEIEVHEIVPYQNTLPAPDGGWWRCEWGGERKCFFGPMMGM